MSPDRFVEPAAPRRPGLTACSLCAGETLEGAEQLPGGQRARLERLAAQGHAELIFTECLDECDRGDVVVATPSPHSEPGTDPRPVWFAQLAGDELTEHLGQWLATGGPGIAQLPTALIEHLIDRDTPPVAAAQEPAAATDRHSASIDGDCHTGTASKCER